MTQRTHALISAFVTPRRAAAESDATSILTSRESEVLLLIARGLSNVEIAQQLELSVETVKTHVKRIYVKCGARDRVQAVIYAYENGMVPRTD
jgi:DNA-binding NarL/FixJ family response regulator